MVWKTLLVGLGKIGMEYDLKKDPGRFVYTHARAISLHKKFELVGAVDPSKEKRKIFTRFYKKKAFSSIKRAFRFQSPDVVVIAAPTSKHLEVLQQTITEGNPRLILCEKPLANKITEAKKMVSLCSKHKIKLFVNYVRRSNPSVLDIKKKINQEHFKTPVKGIVWYSRGFLNNASHFFNCLENWLGRVTDYKLADRGEDLPAGDAEPDVRVFYKKGEVLFSALPRNGIYHHGVEMFFKNGRLRLDHGGRLIEWNPLAPDRRSLHLQRISENASLFPPYANKYQANVFEQISRFLDGGKYDLCEGREALATLDMMLKILNQRK